MPSSAIGAAACCWLSASPLRRAAWLIPPPLVPVASMRGCSRMVANEACGLSVVVSSPAFVNAVEPRRRASDVVPNDNCKPLGETSRLMPLLIIFSVCSEWALKSDCVSWDGRQCTDAAVRRTIKDDSTEPVEYWTEWFAELASVEGEAFAWSLVVSCFFMSVDKKAAKSVAASRHTVRKTACSPNNLAESPTGVSFFQKLVADSCNPA